MEKNGFYFELLDLLKQDSQNRFYSENGKDLLRNKVYESAMKMDKDLIKLLLSNDKIKNKFFTDVDGMLVFDKMAFGWTVNNKAFLEDSYTRFKNSIGLVNKNEQFLSSQNDIVLSFPYKDCILEGGQTREEQERDEIYYNELLAPDDVDKLLAPKVFANPKKYSKEGEEKVKTFNDNENLLIKGNNLLALYSIKERYEGMVKCIYIDPPYNTGSDSFGYNDNFNHSTWLVFMKNRLTVARDLLKNDGVIFVSINHLELGYLLVLMDEIFGRQNRLPIITLKAGTTASYRSINDCPVNVSEYIIGYKAKDFVVKPIYRQSGYSEDYSHYIENIEEDSKNWKLKALANIIHENNGCKTWREFKNKFGINWKQERFNQMQEFAFAHKESIVSLNTLQKPSKKIKEVIQLSKTNREKVFEIKRENASSIYCYNGRTMAFFGSKFRDVDGDLVPTEILTNLWTDISFLGIGPEGGVTLENGKKPEYLIKTILDLSTNEGDLVLDFHIGSGTTAAVAHKMNRRYIGIEQLDYEENSALARLKNVINGDNTGVSQYDDIKWKGGGSFIYCELKELNQKYIERIQNADNKRLNELYEEISKSNFVSYKVDLKNFETAAKDFEDLSIDDKKKLLIEVLDKNMLYVNYSDIDDEDYSVSSEEKVFTKSFYKEV